jgi:predicted permease
MALMSDVRSAIRALIAASGFTTIAVLTLAGSLALTTVILAVVNAYLLRSLPYPEAARLYRVDYATPGQAVPRGMEQLDWSSLSDVVELVIAWDLDVFYLLGREYPESAPGAWVTPDYIAGLGVRAALGRTIGAADYRPDSPAVALISHRLWQSRFGGDASVVGKTFNAYVSDRPEEPEAFTVIGVLPADFWHVNAYSEVLVPLRARSYPYQVRIRPGVAPAVVAERIDRLVRGGIASLPPQFGVRLTSLQHSYVEALRPTLMAVVAAAGLVLVIAAANISVLTIVRARRRERELAMRVALGASHLRVARLLAMEGVLIGGTATAVGLAIAGLTMPALGPLIERSLDRRVPGGLQTLALDTTVIAAVITAGLLVTMAFTVIPMLMVWRSRGVATIVGSGRGLTETSSGRSRAALIAIEVAASVTLLAGAALMVESAIRMLHVDFGIDSGDVVTAGLALRQRSFPREADRAAFYSRLESELRDIARTSAVAFGDWWPLQGSRPRRAETTGADAMVATANPFAVTTRYFETLGMRVLAGRTFTEGDRLGGEPVVIVSASLAARLWPRATAIGRHLTIHPDGNGIPLTATVVGVVNDVRQSHGDADLLDAYLPLAQSASRFAFVYLRSPGAATWEADLRAAIARVHPEVAMGTPRTLDAGLEQERARPRLLAYLLTVFAIIACVLALIGMHGVIAYAVRQRQREIAVRMAVGANAHAVMTLFVRYGVLVLAVGLGVGVACAIGLGRVLQTQLYGVAPAEPRVLGLAAAAFGACGLAAVLWPAWSATTTDPVALLKEQ